MGYGYTVGVCVCVCVVVRLCVMVCCNSVRVCVHQCYELCGCIKWLLRHASDNGKRGTSTSQMYNTLYHTADTENIQWVQCGLDYVPGVASRSMCTSACCHWSGVTYKAFINVAFWCFLYVHTVSPVWIVVPMSWNVMNILFAVTLSPGVCKFAP